MTRRRGTTPKPPTRRHEFTVRQLRYKQNRLLGMNQKDAAIAAGYAETFATKRAYKIERVVKSSIVEELERAGGTNKVLAAKIVEKLHAKRPIGATILVNQKGQLIRAEDEGAIEVDDHATQLKAVELAARLKKQLTDQPAPPSEFHQHFTVILDPGASSDGNHTHPEADLRVSLADRS